MTNQPWRTQYNQEAYTPKREVNKQPSLTVPDQTMTIPEIIARYARGLPLEGYRPPLFDVHDESDDFDWSLLTTDPGGWDRAEAAAVSSDLQSELRELDAKAKARKESFDGVADSDIPGYDTPSPKKAVKSKKADKPDKSPSDDSQSTDATE